MVLVAKDILEKDYLSMVGGTTLFQAVQQMKSTRHGFVVVSNSEGKPVGIVTEWDIVSKAVAEGKDPKNVRLEELMTRDIISVNPEIGIDNLALLMATKGIRRVLVIDGATVLGFITSRTVLARLKDYVERISIQIARLQCPTV